VVTTRCGRFRLQPNGDIAYKGRRTSPVPRGASYWPEDLVWYRFARHHLLIGRGLRQLWRSHDRYPTAHPGNVGRIALGRLRISFSYSRRLDQKLRLYLAGYRGRERLVARGEDPLAFLPRGRLVTWREDRALVLRGSDGRFERLVSPHAIDPQWDRRSRLLVFRTGRRLRVFDGRRVRELARLGAVGVMGSAVVEPQGRLVAVHDATRLVVLDYGGRTVAAAPLPKRQEPADGVSSSVAANAAATAVAFTATDHSHAKETVYVLAARAGRTRALFSAEVDFNGCGWMSSVAWHGQWLLYSNGDLQATILGSTGASGAIDLSHVLTRLPGAERDGLFEIAWAPAP
jgi:hypothetical protein